MTRTLAALMLALTLLGLVSCKKQTPAPVPKAAPSKTLTIAAAANLRQTLPAIIEAFEKDNQNVKVDATYGSSGNFFSQLSNKAPFDVFLSADEEFPAKLIEAGHATKESLYRYATGRVVLWVPKDSPLDVTKGYAILDNPSVKKIAIANPKLAPYGAAAEAALKKAGKYEAVQDKLVLGENIAQTAQFAESGAAQAGFIALALAMSPEMKDKGKYWLVPETDHAPIIQSAVVISHAKEPDLAGRFLTFLRSDAAKGILTRSGFGIP